MYPLKLLLIYIFYNNYKDRCFNLKIETIKVVLPFLYAQKTYFIKVNFRAMQWQYSIQIILQI